MYKLMISLRSFLIFLSLIYTPLYSVYSLRVDYEAIADRITHKVADQLKVEYQLHLIGIGGGMMNHIQMMAMAFDYRQETSVADARKLVIHASQNYLAAINASEEVRPFLKTYPFTSEMIEIRIFFSKPDRNAVGNNQIYCAQLSNNKIGYFAIDKTDKNKEITVHKETYEEALQIINNEKLTQPLSSNIAL